MEVFHYVFPKEEMISYRLEGHCPTCLPDGNYSFLELYCTNPACACNECRILVYKFGPEKQINMDITALANLNLSWSARNSLKYKLKLDKQHEQSKHASKLLDIFAQHMQKENSLSTIKQHYIMIKNNSISMEPNITPSKISRNEMCPCNSGKKYKKCCLLQEALYG